ncbi:hypothetical protein GAPWKB30_1656 [Gilliamella apicola]|nr:hypothetical protein GAPWKB30_1656 [Gilliamella apicola]
MRLNYCFWDSIFVVGVDSKFQQELQKRFFCYQIKSKIVQINI